MMTATMRAPMASADVSPKRLRQPEAQQADEREEGGETGQE